MIGIISGIGSLIVTGAISALVIVAVGASVYFLYRGANSANRGIAHAVSATATVTRVVDSASEGSNYGGVDIELVLKVQPINEAPYETRTTWTVEPAAISKVQEGCMIAIKIDHKDRKRIYPAVTWAQFLDVPPGSLSDNPEV